METRSSPRAVKKLDDVILTQSNNKSCLSLPAHSKNRLFVYLRSSYLSSSSYIKGVMETRSSPRAVKKLDDVILTQSNNKSCLSLPAHSKNRLFIFVAPILKELWKLVPVPARSKN